MGDVFDFARGLALFGHVLDHRDKDAGVGRLASKVENALADLLREHACMRKRHVGFPFFAKRDALVGGHVGAFANRAREGFEFNWRGHRDEPKKFSHFAVDDRDIRVGVSHAETMRHAVER